MRKNIAILALSLLILNALTAKLDNSIMTSNQLPGGTFSSKEYIIDGKNNQKGGSSTSGSYLTEDSYSVTIGATGSLQNHQGPSRQVEVKSTIQQSLAKGVNRPKQLPKPGSFNIIAAIQQNKQALETLDYLQHNLSPLLSTSSLTQCSYQVVNGINYRFIFELEVFLNRRVKYLVQVHRTFAGKYQITKSQYCQLSKSKPKLQEFVRFQATNSNNKIMDLINDQVLFQLKDSFNGKGQLLDFFTRPPYFILNYKVGRSDLYKVEVLYDVVINAANILAVTKQTQPMVKNSSLYQGSIISAKQSIIPAIASNSAPVIMNKNQPFGTGKDTLGVSVKEEIIRGRQLPEIGDKTVSNLKQTMPTISDSVSPKAGVAEVTNELTSNQSQKRQVRVVHSKPTQSASPSFTIAQNNDRLLQKLSGISDPALIPFLTSSQPTNTKQIEEVVRFIIEKVKITGDFTIVLINQIKYGIRLILQMKEDHKLFEAVVTSDNQAPEILVWRRISVIGDADPDVFTQYFRINPDEDVKNLVRGIFTGDDMIRRFKDIISAEKKVSFDGIYYRVVLESTTSNKFLVKFYYIPDKKYTEIIHYELINNNFDPKSETKLTSIPDADLNFKKCRDYLFSNYGNVLKDASLSFASTYTKNGLVYYRLVFIGLNGKYEAVLTINVETGYVSVCRWQKMEDGYVPIQLEKLKQNDEFKSIRLSVKQYIQNRFNFDSEVKYLQVKNIAGLNSFYKFMMERPFPFILSIQERDSDHSLYIRGVERVPIAPANEYYNDRLFAGYSSLRLSELQFDDVYQVFYTVLQKQTQIRDGNNKVAAAFRMKTPEGIYYKIIYRINGNQYLASFSYLFVTAEYKLVSFEAYLRSIEQGDYRWKCSQVDSKSATCNQCQTSNLLTAGRCYTKINGCSIQLASSCHACQPGFIRTHHVCELSSQNSIPTAAPLSRTQKIIVRSTGSKTIAYQNGNDQNCIQSGNSGCKKCANRFYIENGICKKVQDQCGEYTENGVCLKCYEGHYLSNQFCVALDPLCVQANSAGICVRCYKNYINIDGKCYIKSNVEITQSNVLRDQLCLQWKGSQCSKCQYGCYLSKKTNRCTIKDPFCQQFDQLFEECKLCSRGYRKNGSECQRNA